MIDPSTIRVLIVDDDGERRSATWQSLEDIGFAEICVAHSSFEALPIASAHRVHLVISELRMPGMSGLRLLAKIREDPLLGKIGFIMLSEGSDIDAVRRARELGASSFVLRPFSSADLKDRIEQIFGRLEPPRAPGEPGEDRTSDDADDVFGGDRT